MIPARSDGGNAAQGNAVGPLYLYGLGAIGSSAVPQLAVVVLPPCPDRAVVLHGQGVRIPRRNGGDTAQGTASATGHLYLHGLGALGSSAVPQLAVVVHPPCPDRAVVLQGQGVIPSPRDGGNADQGSASATGHLYLHGLGARGRISSSAIPQLAVAVRPPCPDRAAVLHGQGVRRPRRDGGDAAQGTGTGTGHLYLHSLGALGSSAVPQLAIIVIPRCPDRTVVLQGQGVKLPPRNLRLHSRRKGGNGESGQKDRTSDECQPESGNAALYVSFFHGDILPRGNHFFASAKKSQFLLYIRGGWK